MREVVHTCGGDRPKPTEGNIMSSESETSGQDPHKGNEAVKEEAVTNTSEPSDAASSNPESAPSSKPAETGPSSPGPESKGEESIASHLQACMNIVQKELDGAIAHAADETEKFSDRNGITAIVKSPERTPPADSNTEPTEDPPPSSDTAQASTKNATTSEQSKEDKEAQIEEEGIESHVESTLRDVQKELDGAIAHASDGAEKFSDRTGLTNIIHKTVSVTQNALDKSGLTKAATQAAHVFSHPQETASKHPTPSQYHTPTTSQKTDQSTSSKADHTSAVSYKSDETSEPVARSDADKK